MAEVINRLSITLKIQVAKTESVIALLHITWRKSEIEIFCFQLILPLKAVELVKTERFSISTDTAVTIT